MAKKKRQAKEIHVNELHIKADKVVFHDEERQQTESQAQGPMEDMFGFFPTPAQTSTDEEQANQGEDESNQENEESQQGGWSWF